MLRCPCSEPLPPPRPKIIDLPGSVKIPRAQIYEERARRLGEKYGLEIKPSEWHSTEGHALRVDKPIRMRVRRECHVCTAQFGSTKECPKCQHPWCQQCVRYPPYRTEEELVASRIHRAAILKEQKENAPIIPDYVDPLREKKIVLRKPAKTGGQDLVHKKPRQRVRRTCHECQTLFRGSDKACANCSHVRCTDCPRDPYVLPHLFLPSAAPYVLPPFAPWEERSADHCSSFHHAPEPRRTSTRTVIRATSLDQTLSRTTSATAARTTSRLRPSQAQSAASAHTKSVINAHGCCRKKSSPNQTQRLCRASK